MNQINTPEVILSKVNELLKKKDDETALIIINDFLSNNKKKIWSQSMEDLIIIFVELAINQNKLKYLKEALNFYRGLSQVTNIDSFVSVLSETKKIVEEKYIQALKNYKGIKVDVNDLDDEEDNSNDIFSESVSSSKEKEDLIISQKFIWETYKILLDITKTNSKLFTLYSQILKAAFDFCKDNKRTAEFKRLSDSVRNYLQTLIKSQKKQNFLNKVQLSSPDVLRTLIQMRLNQINTATYLEQWLEAFKTAEDIIYLIDKYEKIQAPQKDEKKQKKTLKLNPILKLEFYSNIEKLFWISNYPLYHSYANILVKNISNKAQMNLNEKTKEKLKQFNLDILNEKIILSVLSSPTKNLYTNYIKFGDEIYEEQNDIEIETCKRMMAILKLSHVPSRQYLINYILNNNILSECPEHIQQLYDIFERENNPIKITKKFVKIISILEKENNNEFTKYINNLRENLIIKCITLISKSYDSISIDRLMKLFKPCGLDEIQIEDILTEISRIGLVKCQINHNDKMINFNINDNKTEFFNKNINNFIINSKKIIEDIVKRTNVEKIKKLREKLYEQIRTQNNDSFKTTEERMKNIKQKVTELKEYYDNKNAIKFELKQQTLDTKQRKRLELIEKEKLEKEQIKDAQQKKEYENKIKRYVIDLLRKYTNSIQLNDGKKIKLDDLLKDLNRVSEEEIFKALQEQETESKIKKERRLHQINKNLDYTLREYRKRDNEKFEAKMKKEEEEFNGILEKQSKDYYDEKIGMKETLKKFKPFKDTYFTNIKNENTTKYNEEMTKFKKDLEKRVQEDIYKELKEEFKKYFDDFKKKEEEAESKNKKSESWVRGQNFNRNRDFHRGANYQEVKKEYSQPLEFNRGGNFRVEDQPVRKVVNQSNNDGWNRGGNAEKPKEKPKDNDVWIRGANAEKPKEKPKDKKVEKGKEFKRGGNFDKNKDSNDGWNRGGNAEKKK